MKYLHTMIRVFDLDKSISFFNKLGLIETRRHEVESGSFTLVFMATAKGEPEIELTYNWDQDEPYTTGRFFGHLAFGVENIYKKCEELSREGITILRPPRDGFMAFIKSPDGIPVELLQMGERLKPEEPWLSMENSGSW